MKSIAAVLSVLLFTSLALAQDKLPAPAGSPHDTMLREKNAPDREIGPMSRCLHGKRLFPMHGRNFRPDMMGPGCGNARLDDMVKERRHMGRPFPPPPFFFAPALLLLLLVVGIVNILLTVIVSLDMARNGRFNGLWIPVLLLVGIPGAAIYALFRIGDKIPCKQV